MKSVRIFSAILLAAMAGACTTTKITRSDILEPIGPVDPSGKTIVLMAAGTSAEDAARVEDALADRINQGGRAAGVAGHTIVPAGSDIDQLKAALVGAGADVLVFLKLTGTSETTVGREEQYYYGTMVTYYDDIWRSSPLENSSRTYTTYEVETVCYRVSDGKPFWRAESETFAPNSEREFAKGMIESAAKAMRKQGLLAE